MISKKYGTLLFQSRHPNGTADKIRLVAKDFNETLHIAFADLLTNWERYVEAYAKQQ